MSARLITSEISLNWNKPHGLIRVQDDYITVVAWWV